MSGKKAELFDLPNDLGESRNLIKEHPKTVEKLREQSAIYWQKVSASKWIQDAFRKPKGDGSIGIFLIPVGSNLWLEIGYKNIGKNQGFQSHAPFLLPQKHQEIERRNEGPIWLHS